MLQNIRKRIGRLTAAVPRNVLLTLVVGGLFFGAFLLAAPPVWEYTNSPSFCGTTCHTMPPEFTTYLASPHARVLCVDCHIGRDLIAVQLFRKSAHLRFIADTLLQNYEYPIRAGELRPARETCERCHFPEKFSDDSLRVIHTSENDRDNSSYDTYLVMHTGGGSQREGLGRGIHWHIENRITYVALDALEQEIPWVRVENADGSVDEYAAINSPVDSTNVDQYAIHEMDCMTCHNRISHLIEPAYRAVDEALARGDVSRDIPFIRTRGVELLDTAYNTIDDAKASIASLDAYYRDNYPDFYGDGAEKVSQAVDVLTQIYEDSNYPEQLLNWTTHPNNVGHRDSPGCFRCHDGEHFNADGEAIRLECNLCHTIPKIVRPDDIEPLLPLTTGLEPSSHLDSSWINRHHNLMDATCANCHDTTNAGGSDNSSFCSNSACHGSGWKYAGFDAPGLALVLGLNQPVQKPLLEDFDGEPTYAILQPLFVQICGGCHGARPSKGLALTDYDSLMTGSDSGPVVVPGTSTDSLMIQKLTAGHFARLTSHQMELLARWIDAGAPAS
ncbi:MAG: NapC/NirT family cytochrome c [Anaerolineae bacterium]|nr:NapC/NirT family cytochrome c [Anaerolineae bacterium]